MTVKGVKVKNDKKERKSKLNIEYEPLLVGKNNKATQNNKEKGKIKELEEQQIKKVKATQSDKDKGNKNKEVKEKTGKIVKTKRHRQREREESGRKLFNRKTS